MPDLHDTLEYEKVIAEANGVRCPVCEEELTSCDDCDDELRAGSVMYCVTGEASHQVHICYTCKHRRDQEDGMRFWRCTQECDGTPCYLKDKEKPKPCESIPDADWLECTAQQAGE
jgi:hypothetical protein